MRLVEKYKGLIWSACYEGEMKDVFSRLFQKWNDAEYLEEYFHSHEDFLQNNPHFQGWSVKEVIMNASREARFFHQAFTKYYWNQINNTHPNLDDRFITLNRLIEGKDDLKRKMYGHPPDPRLMTSVFRLYAVKVPSSYEDEPPAYIITGGGIKLSDAMPQMKELNHEYNRIEVVQNWLVQNKITNKEQLIDYQNNANQSNDGVGKAGAANGE